VSNYLLLGLGALVLVGMNVWAHRPPRWLRAEALARERHPAGRKRPQEPADGPAVVAVRTTGVPGLPRDGRPLSKQEWAAFNGCLWASNTSVDEPHYGGGRAN
jgi:hypothetical protein